LFACIYIYISHDIPTRQNMYTSNAGDSHSKPYSLAKDNIVSMEHWDADTLAYNKMPWTGSSASDAVVQKGFKLDTM
jgi:hypothetical protein